MLTKAHIKNGIKTIVANELAEFQKQFNFPYNGNANNDVDKEHRKYIAKQLHKRLCNMTSWLYTGSAYKIGDVELLNVLVTKLPWNGSAKAIADFIFKTDFFHRMCYNIRMHSTQYVITHPWNKNYTLMQSMTGNVHIANANHPFDKLKDFLNNDFKVSLAAFMKINGLPEYASQSTAGGKLFGRNYSFEVYGFKKMCLKLENLSDKRYGYSKSKQRYKNQRSNSEVAHLLVDHINEFGFSRNVGIQKTVDHTLIMFEIVFDKRVERDPAKVIDNFLQSIYGVENPVTNEEILEIFTEPPKPTPPKTSMFALEDASTGIRSKILQFQNEQTLLQQEIETQKEVIASANRAIDTKNNELKKRSEKIEDLRKALSILND